MKHSLIFPYRGILFSFSIFLLLAACIPLSDGSNSQASCSPSGNWQLVWEDNFDTWTAANWDFDLGNFLPNTNVAGWGNNELQSYTNNQGNTTANNIQVQNGTLIIRAKKETTRDSANRSFAYSSARLKSTHSQTYGCMEVRAKLPSGKGIWPAIWMLPKNSSYGTWAASGEIDILETRGSKPKEAIGTIHYGGQHPNNRYSGGTYTFSGNDSTTNFHTYSIVWLNNMIVWYIDGTEYSRKTSWSSNSNPFPAPFDKNFFMILNVAVGGHFDGNPNSTTSFPVEMEIDYVRFYSSR